LDLALLIDAQHHCLVWRVEIQPDDVDDFLGEPGIVRELERARQVRLEAVLLPDAVHRRVADAYLLGKHARSNAWRFQAFPRRSRHDREPTSSPMRL
jgi:hypothetical protein